MRNRYLANHDVLTELANRAQFLRHLDDVLAQADEQQERIAVHFIDLDDFKQSQRRGAPASAGQCRRRHRLRDRS
jgi:predicted signal transduction protein with EAL and GGDEF domain